MAKFNKTLGSAVLDEKCKELLRAGKPHAEISAVLFQQGFSKERISDKYISMFACENGFRRLHRQSKVGKTPTSDQVMKDIEEVYTSNLSSHLKLLVIKTVINKS